MITSKLFILGLVVLLVGIVVIEAWLRRGKSRPLSHRFARSRHIKPLGTEATDEASVAGILRRNSALASKTGAGGSQSTWIATGAIPLAPYPEDETYAARYIGKHEERKH
jgi:hypothetical protein